MFIKIFFLRPISLTFFKIDFLHSFSSFHIFSNSSAFSKYSVMGLSFKCEHISYPKISQFFKETIG